MAGLHCLMSMLGAAGRLLALRVNNNCYLICVYNKYSKVDAQCNDCENIVTVDDVLNGINHAKSNKCDGYGLVYTDHFIYAPHKLLVFSIFVIHINGVSRVYPGWFLCSHNSTNHFIYAPHILLVFLSLSFTSMVYHGYTPDGFYVATIQPITLFMLLTNYLFFYLCYSHQWCITGIPRLVFM